jgi:hypothetical protein
LPGSPRRDWDQVMKAKPSDFAKSSSGSLREALKIPSLRVSAKPAPNTKEGRRDDIAYGVNSLEKLVDAFDERQRALRKKAD